MVGRFRNLPAGIGVLDPEQELAALVPGEEPVEESRMDSADVEEAGGARRKADSHGHTAV